MTDNTEIDLDNFQALLDRFEVFANPSEIHGMLSGLICGGTKLDDTGWLKILSDFYHQGLEFHEEVIIRLELLFRKVYEALQDEHMGFKMLLPEDNEPLTLRSKALADWTQGFLLGFAVNSDMLKQASEEINEAVKDFAEISRMAHDGDESEENEHAYSELYEYVRISTIMCFSEIANGRGAQDKVTLH